MPKAIKKKIETPKKSGEGDIGSALEAMKGRAEALDRYKNFIIAGAVIIALGIAAYAFTLNSAKKARILEYEGYRLYHGKFDQPNLEITRLQDALKKFEEAYSAKKTPFSLYYMALCQSDLGDGKKASETFQRVIKEFPSDAVFAPLAKYRLAGTALKDGNEEAAIANLEKIASDKDSLLRDLALAEQSRILEDSGRKEEAMAKLKQLVEEHPESPISKLAKPQVDKYAAAIANGSAVANSAAPAGADKGK